MQSSNLVTYVLLCVKTPSPGLIVYNQHFVDEESTSLERSASVQRVMLPLVSDHNQVRTQRGKLTKYNYIYC